MTDTVTRVARPRGEVTPTECQTLEQLRKAADASQADYRAGVVAVLKRGASFAEVARVTGLSTNTLQRWKREAGQ